MTGKALLSSAVHDAETDWELGGYGLYSYFLLGSPPKDDLQQAKYKRAIEAYLRQLPSMVELGNHVARSRLNIALLPVKQPFKLPDSAKGLVTSSSALLHDYDYARAKVILQGLSDSAYENGPYLVAIRPASSEGARVRAVLDMSRASPEVSDEWSSVPLRSMAVTSAAVRRPFSPRDATFAPASTRPELSSALNG